MASVIFPFGFLVQNAPPTPPTFAGSRQSASMKELFRAWVGKVPKDSPSYMELRDRLDFGILFFSFGVLVSASGAWSNFSNQTFSPHGYTAQRSGLFDATFLASGIVAALVSAPLFDRFLSPYLGFTIRTLLPIVAAIWVSFIWVVRPNNSAVLFPLNAILGICSFIMLPIALELGAEVTRNAEMSCTLLFFGYALAACVFDFSVTSY